MAFRNSPKDRYAFPKPVYPAPCPSFQAIKEERSRTIEKHRRLPRKFPFPSSKFPSSFFCTIKSFKAASSGSSSLVDMVLLRLFWFRFVQNMNLPPLEPARGVDQSS